jgi:ATP-dependent RNA helicase SUPV3L1/SUV3
MKQAALQALTTEVSARAISLATTADTELRLTRQGEVVWQNNAIGKLHAGDTRFKPRVEVIADDLLSPSLREDVRQRLQKFVDRTISAAIEPLMKLEDPETLDGTTRGLAYRIAENFGVLAREDVATEVKNLGQEDRAKLRGFGVRFGAHTLFVPTLLKPAPTEIRMLLWWLEQSKAGTVSGPVPSLPPNGLTSMAADMNLPPGFYRMGGYRISGTRAVRVDMLERLADMIRDRLFWKPRIPEEQRPAGSVEGGGFTVVPDMMSIVGCSGEDFQNILISLGYRSQIKQVPKPVKGVQPTPEVVESTPEADAATESISEVVEPAPEAPPEMQEVAIWWPEGMGPFKVRPPRVEKPRTEKPFQKRDHKAGKPSFDKHSRKPDAKPDRPHRAEHKRPEKPMDPNSPFAALAALKATMGQGKN